MNTIIKKIAIIAATTTIAGTALFSANSASATTFVVSYEGEAAGVENTTATFSVSGVETFNNVPAQTYPQSFTTNFGTSGAGSTITGTYQAASGQGIQINTADQYGGAGGTGNYAVAFPNTPYELTLTSNVAGGVNYFGFWLSALDVGNYVTFYGSNGQVLFTFDPQDVLNAVQRSANPGLYYGNPNSAFKGQDGGEPFIFLNFFDTTGTFSKVIFNEVNFGGGYESDNQTVGHYVTMGQGTVVPLTLSSANLYATAAQNQQFVTAAVPEPATWGLMALGFGAILFHGRRFRAHREKSVAEA